MYILSYTCLLCETFLKEMLQAVLLESSRATWHTHVPQMVLKLTLGTEVVMIIIRVINSVSYQGVMHLLDLIHAMAFTHAGS